MSTLCLIINHENERGEVSVWNFIPFKDVPNRSDLFTIHYFESKRRLKKAIQFILHIFLDSSITEGWQNIITASVFFHWQPAIQPVAVIWLCKHYGMPEVDTVTIKRLSFKQSNYKPNLKCECTDYKPNYIVHSLGNDVLLLTLYGSENSGRKKEPLQLFHW